MIKVFVTNAVISNGYGGAPALRFSENGDSVRFRFGKKEYDAKAENKTRWINLSVKAFGNVCERIKSMKLKEGSFVNIIGRLDEDVWTDQSTGEQKSVMVVIVDEIEYAFAGGSKGKENQTSNQPLNGGAMQNGLSQGTGTSMYSGGFAGYEPFSMGSLFDEN